MKSVRNTCLLTGIVVVVLNDLFAKECTEEYDSFLKWYQLEEVKHCNDKELKTWNYHINLTNYNQVEMLKSHTRYDSFKRRVWNELKKVNWTSYLNESVQRQYRLIRRDVGSGVLDGERGHQLNSITAEMEKNIAEMKSTVINNLTTSDEILELWLSWKRVGKHNALLYPKSVQLWNEACQLHGFGDCTSFWQSFYEDPDFVLHIKQIWARVKPLYKQLHAYVRRKLKLKYSDVMKNAESPIPAHLLGSKYASNWRNIYSFTSPFPNKRSKDVSESLVEKGYTPEQMFEEVENFFASLGLSRMSTEFWEKSLLKIPQNCNVNCQATAWDFCTGNDFRIKQCTRVNYKHFITAHHEMGHVQYFMEYAHLPTAFRTGANPGFHEAIGDVIALSVVGIRHMKRLNLTKDSTNDNERTINFLYSMALEKVAALPFNLLVDLWRWDIFNGKINFKEMNRKWWEMRLDYQGISAPVNITEDDFELGSITQVTANLDFIKYFVSCIIQFQFHEGLCQASGHLGPLHTCDIYGSKIAGRKLKEALSVGASRPWPEVMMILTNGKSRRMDARSLLKYFHPLHIWLKNSNRGDKVGWTKVYRKVSK